LRSFLISSRVVPFFPGLWRLGDCWIAVGPSANVEAEEGELSEDIVEVSVRDILGDGFECDDKSDDLENKP
jgi:hypothetical protein